MRPHGWIKSFPSGTQQALVESATVLGRELKVILPPEVPTGKAKLLVMIEEQVDRGELPEREAARRGILESEGSGRIRRRTDGSPTQ